MRAILVSVNFADILSITLPYNYHHFDEMLVVTDKGDSATKQVCIEYAVPFYETDSFYEDGAVFNKWRALEEGLDHFGRHGLMCVMDVDVLWPYEVDKTQFVFGNLYSPQRRILEDIPQYNINLDWSTLPLDTCPEFAGYSQIFYADDPVLVKPPWHQTNWVHAGGADSFFQMKWPVSNKIRPDFEVLHLGKDGQNWCGRVTPYLDGTKPNNAETNTRLLIEFKNSRTNGPDRFKKEKI